jgi:hypothetical protein
VREESWDFGFGNWDLRKRKNLPQRRRGRREKKETLDFKDGRRGTFEAGMNREDGRMGVLEGGSWKSTGVADLSPEA